MEPTAGETQKGEAGVPARFRRIPYYPALALDVLCEKVFTLFGMEPPLIRRHIDLFVKNHAYRIDRAKDELGYRPKVGLAEGARRTLAWYKEQGLL